MKKRWSGTGDRSVRDNLLKLPTPIGVLNLEKSIL